MSAKKTIGSLLVAIGVDLTDFEKKMNQVNRQFGKLGDQVQEAGTQIGAAFGAVSLAIAGGLGFAVKKAADFEQGLSNIKAVSGSTAQEMEQLKKLALDMGASTKYSATEAAQGIEELVKAGVSMTDITNGGLKGALSLATAGGLELAEAAEIASTALNAFRKDGLSVSKAADILAGAANASATSVGELKFGLSSVSAVASSVGMTFEDTTAALAVFAQNGLKGSDAGTSLKTMLMNLQPSTDKARALFEELGLVTEDGSSRFFDATGKLKSLDQIAGILQQSMSGLTDAQRLSKMETIFGSDAIRAANILFKEGASGVEKMKAAMGKVTAEEVAAEKLNNLNGAIEQLKGAFETLMISLGETLVPMFKSIAAILGNVVEWFNQLSPATKKFIVIGAAVTAAITGLIAVIAFLTASLGALLAVEWAVLAPLLLIIGKVLLVIGAFTALGVAIGILYKKNEAFANFVNKTWNGIQAIFQTASAVIIPIAKEIWDTLKKNFMEIWTALKPLLEAAWSFINEIFNRISKNGDEKLGALKKIFEIVFGAVGTIVKVAMETIAGTIQFTLNLVTTIFKVATNLIKLIFLGAFEQIKTGIQISMTVIHGIIQTITALIRGDWDGAWNAIKNTVSSVFTQMKTFITNMIDIFKGAGKGIITALADGIKNHVSIVVNSIKDVVQKIRDFLPFSPAKVGPLSDLDQLDFAGPISNAIRGGVPDVQASMNSMLQVPDVNPNVTTESSGTTVIMQLDGKTIAKSTFAQMGGTFRLRGAVT